MSQYYYNPFESTGAQPDPMLLKRQREYSEKHEIRKISFTIGIAIIAYLVIQLIEGFFLGIEPLKSLYTNSPLFQYSYQIIGISFLAVAVPFGIMALINKKSFRYNLVPAKKLGFAKGFLWTAFGMLCCSGAQFVVSFVVTFIENLFKIKLKQGELADPDSVFSCVMLVVAIGIIPAICEEFAMRCCSLQLLRKYGSGFAVFAVSIIFGLLHGNVIQFIFAFAIGVVLGFVTIKTDSIVPAVFIHGINNTISASSNIITYAADKKTADTVVVVAFVAWMIIGAVAMIFLINSGDLKRKNKNEKNTAMPVQPMAQESVLTTGQKFASFLFPWMIMPFLMLLVLTALTIERA